MTKTSTTFTSSTKICIMAKDLPKTLYFYNSSLHLLYTAKPENLNPFI